MAAVDYFLKIDGIEGESTDAKHKGEIDVESFSWGAAQTVPSPGGGGGGGGAGKVHVQDFHFTARTSKASPRLVLACASGKHVKSATLTARRAGKGQQEFLVYRFTDVLVSAYQTGGAAGDVVPTDQISLSFAKIELEYRAQKPDGSLEPPVKAGWDVKQAKPI